MRTGETRLPPSAMLPPAWFALPFLVGYRISRTLRIPFAPRRWRWVAALWLVAAGGGLFKAALEAMAEQDESPEPWNPTARIVDTGVYEHSRNPIYIAYVLIYAGLGLALNALAALLLLPLAIKLVTRFVIEPEERLLEQIDPDGWADYAAHTPRWVV